MPLIKPRTRGKQIVRHITRLDRENHETLYAYAAFLGESTDYVLNQLIEAKLAKDKEFVRWRGAHPESCVPRTAAPSKQTAQASAEPRRDHEPAPMAFEPRAGRP